MSLINDAVQARGDRSSAAAGNATVLFPSTTPTRTKLAEKVLDSTINIPPLIYQNQGGIVGIYVARDVDFSSVYELEPRVQRRGGAPCKSCGPCRRCWLGDATRSSSSCGRCATSSTHPACWRSASTGPASCSSNAPAMAAPRIPELTHERCLSLATAVATCSDQHTNEQTRCSRHPARRGERIQFVIPRAPCRAERCRSRCASPRIRSSRLDDFEREGLFERAAVSAPDRELLPFEHELLELKDAGRYAEFLRLAVRKHQTIVVSGKTGSGKTTFMKGLVEEVPEHERLITIQDTAELTLPNHPNVVHLFYSKDAQGASAVTAKSLLEACLRMKPDRIFLAEVRGDECFYFVRLAASGHPGSITSVHAGSCALAFEQMSLMIRESGAGGGLRMNEIKWLLSVGVDVVVQFDRDERGRFISEIFYEPRRQRLGRWDEHAAAA